MHAWATAYSLTWFQTLVIQVGELTHCRSLHNFRSLRWVKRQETVPFGSVKEVRKRDIRVRSAVQCSTYSHCIHRPQCQTSHNTTLAWHSTAWAELWQRAQGQEGQAGRQRGGEGHTKQGKHTHTHTHRERGSRQGGRQESARMSPSFLSMFLSAIMSRLLCSIMRAWRCL